MNFVFQTFAGAFRPRCLRSCCNTVAASIGRSNSSVYSGFLICCIVMMACCRVTGAADDAYFETHVRPLLVERCYKCHSGTKTSGGLALDSRSGWQTGGESGTAIVPGKPDESLLISAIKYEGPKMPPADAGGRLTDSEVAVLEQWVQSGAHDPRESSVRLGGMSLDEAKTWWAFQPLPEVSANTRFFSYFSGSCQA